MQEVSDRKVNSLFAKLMPHQCGSVGVNGGEICVAGNSYHFTASRNATSSLQPPAVVVVPDNFHSGGDTANSEKGLDSGGAAARRRHSLACCPIALQVFEADRPSSSFFRPLILHRNLFVLGSRCLKWNLHASANNAIGIVMRKQKLLSETWEWPTWR